MNHINLTALKNEITSIKRSMLYYRKKYLDLDVKLTNLLHMKSQIEAGNESRKGILKLCSCGSIVMRMSVHRNKARKRGCTKEHKIIKSFKRGTDRAIIRQGRIEWIAEENAGN